MLVLGRGSALAAEAAPPGAAGVPRAYLPLVVSAAPSCELAPCLLSPADGAQVDTLLPTFTWDAGAEDDALSRLHICTTEDVPCGGGYPSFLIAGGPGIHALRPQENLPARQIWWAVELQYLDDQGVAHDVFSPVRTLEVVGDLPLLPAPTLLGPSGTVTETTLTFTWESVPGALDYKLCYWGEKGWPCEVTDQPELTLTFPAVEQRYWWWVEARNYYGYSEHNLMLVHVKPPASNLPGQTAR